jgi:hypothetical protein
VIDSGSHEWEGQGGCEEIASQASNKAIGWQTAKKQHKAFVNTLLQCNMHIIVCLRAREKVDFTNMSKPVSLGIQPICEKNLMFEMTASLLMENCGQTQVPLKVPADLIPHLGRGTGYIGEADGRAIRAWVDGAKTLDPDVERARNTLQAVTLKGTKALGEAWKATPAAIQKKLGADFLATVKKAAADHENPAGETQVSDRFAAPDDGEV